MDGKKNSSSSHPTKHKPQVFKQPYVKHILNPHLAWKPKSGSTESCSSRSLKQKLPYLLRGCKLCGDTAHSAYYFPAITFCLICHQNDHRTCEHATFTCIKRMTQTRININHEDLLFDTTFEAPGNDFSDNGTTFSDAKEYDTKCGAKGILVPKGFVLATLFGYGTKGSGIAKSGNHPSGVWGEKVIGFGLMVNSERGYKGGFERDSFSPCGNEEFKGLADKALKVISIHYIDGP
ncbi:hypothetical protein Tco_0629172 [Tanacetum coccineum]|uniref:Uncharacterized protein n=1 Tax=Tanacetum coccineum TaxID=301880 RepID=A0ABQ4WSD2_9ASTR